MGSFAAYKKVGSLEVLRIAAAVLVVCFHIQTAFGATITHPFLKPLLEGGFRGVDFFFVLSGFIILRVHRADLGRPERLADYLFSRLTRVYPSVWILSLPAIALYAVSAEDALKAAKLGSPALLASVLLLPQTAVPLINVTWTLTFELFFYLSFALMIVNLRLGLFFFLVWQALTLASVLLDASWGLYGYYLRGLCLEFSVGMGAAWFLSAPLSRSVGPRLWWGLLLAGLAVFFFGVALDPGSTWASVPCAAGAALIIMASVRLEETGRLRVPARLAALGGASYAIYLVHFSAIQLARTLLSGLDITGGGLLFVPYLVIGIGAGLLFYKVVDRPVQRRLRGVRSVVIGSDRRRNGAMST